MKEEKCKGMLIRPENKRCLIAIHVRLFELWVKFKTSVQKNSTYSSVWKKNVDSGILLASRNGDRKIQQPIITLSRLPTRIRKKNQFSHGSDERLPNRTNEKYLEWLHSEDKLKL